MCVAMANTDAPLHSQSYKPLSRCTLPGPDDPSTAVGRPEICESAPAANAPASSLRTWMNVMSASCRRSASTIGFAESPTMPYTFRIPASTIWSTSCSATVVPISISCSADELRGGRGEHVDVGHVPQVLEALRAGALDQAVLVVV